MAIFNRFLVVDVPKDIHCEPDGRHPAFDVRFAADGEIPFPQVILRTADKEILLNGEAIAASQVDPGVWEYVAAVPAGAIAGNRIDIQIEGCRQADIRARPGRRLDQGVPGSTPGPSRAPEGGRARGGFRRCRGQAVLRHPQAHAPAVLQHHGPQLLGRREGSDLRLARGQLHGFHPRRRAAIHRRRAPACGALDELERLADRAARPLRGRGALRRALCRLEQCTASVGRGRDRARQSAHLLLGLRLLPPVDAPDPGPGHRPADRLAPRSDQARLRRRGVAGPVPARDRLSCAHDPGPGRGRRDGGDL